MFTGIVEATAKVHSSMDGRLTVGRPMSFADLRVGDSIAVSGVCLTVVDVTEDSIAFDVIPETIQKTKLGSLKSGDRINVERAMKAEARLHGHIVQGHVEGTGIIRNAEFGMQNASLSIAIPQELIRFVLPKGSITLDGVSLTVADVQENAVTVALIPHTLRETTLGELQAGDLVNIETDVLAKYAAKMIV